MLDDIRIGARTFLRSPGFAALAILTLALGIAANTAMFSVVNGVLLRPLPFPDPDRVVRLYTTTAGRSEGSHSAGDFLDITREQQSFSGIAGYRPDSFAVSTPSGQVIRFNGSHVTAGFFDVFGVPADTGRAFAATADRGVGGRVVLSHQAAARISPDVSALVGQTLRVNSVANLVVGIMPASFAVPQDAELWQLSARDVPPSPLAQGENDREIRYFQAVARLKTNVGEAAIQADLDRLAASVNASHGAGSESRALRIVPLRDDLVGDVRAAILILQAGVGLVLFIACVNISALLIARTTGRHRELAVRTALGARRGRLLRQLLTESSILGVAGGAIGLLLGQWGVTALLRVLPSNLPRTGEIAIDGTVAVATLVTAVLASVFFGALPALQASRTNAAQVLRAVAGRSATGRSFGRSALVVVEIALTLIVLATAGVLGGTLVRLQNVQPGFAADGVTVANVAIPATRYPDSEAQTRFQDRLLERLATEPGVTAAATGFPAPLGGSSASGNFAIVGMPAQPGADSPFAYLNAVSPGFFEAMGIPVVAGRSFTPADLGPTPVAIVSATTARRYWPDGDAVGRQLTFDSDSDDPPFTIVGISGDVHQLGLKAEPPPLLYFPYTQFPLPFTTVIVRSPLETSAVSNALVAAFADVDPELPVPEPATLQSVVDRSLTDARFRTFVFGLLALVALALAAVGVYGLISYSVAQQTREMGIRLALGASPRQLLTGVVGRGALLAVTGVGLGLIGAIFTGRAIESFLFGVPGADPRTLAAVSVVLLLVSIAASYGPARRALKVDPTSALRSD